MLLTKDLNDKVRERIQQSAPFRREYLREGLHCVITGDVETGKSVLRDYINGTLGFVALGKALSRDPKTLMRMLSPKGNPTIRNFFEIVTYLQKIERFKLEVVESQPAKSSARRAA